MNDQIPDEILAKPVTISLGDAHLILHALWNSQDFDLASTLELAITNAAYEENLFPKQYIKYKADSPFFSDIEEGHIAGMFIYGNGSNHWSGCLHIFDHGTLFDPRYSVMIGRSEYSSNDLRDIEKHLFWFAISEGFLK